MTAANDAPLTLRVTDNALLRWLERVHGFEIERLRDILKDELEAAIRSFGAISAHEEGAFLFVVDGATLVTVLEPGERSQRDRCSRIPRVPG